MKILITGIGGFLGSHLADKLLRLGHEVVGVDNLIGGAESNIPLGVPWAHSDCRSFESMNEMCWGCDVVFHCAATAHEGFSVFSPSFITSNIYEASVSVFSAACANKVKRIVFCSSMARYGDNHTPFHESMRTRPRDPYGIAKVAAEQTLACLADAHDLEYAIAVPHNIIGPRQCYTDPYRNVASIMANRMLQGKQPIIYGDGEQVRCFSPIQDVIDPLARMMDCPSGEVINIGPDEGAITINQLAEELASIIGMDLDPIYVADRPREVRFATCSSNKARRLLDYNSTKPLRASLEELVSNIDPKPFEYKFNVEIEHGCPSTWSEKLI